MMSSDRKLIFEPPVPLPVPETPVPSQGAAHSAGLGFIGPFLMKSLLEQTRGRKSMFSLVVFRRKAR